MSLEISKITDAALNSIAKQADVNKDNELSGDEYQIFAQKASAAGVDYKTIGDTLEMNAFERWWFDVDKVATDGKNDGKLSAGEVAESSLKGFFGGIVKSAVKNPLATLATLGITIGATVATGGAALPIIIGLGAGASAACIGKGLYDYAKADNDTDAKTALEGTGTATAGLALSLVGATSANKAAANAGVKGLQGLDKASWSENVIAMFKSIPEAFMQSGKNIKGNALTWLSALKGDKIIYANSNATRTGVETGYQTGNKVQDAYKVDLNGTVEEVLAKNPGLKYDAQAGKYYVETSWGENMYVQNENYMYVKYGESVDSKTGVKTIDHNVVEGKEFYDTYINHAKFEANGTKRYINPENLKPGQHVETSKNAPARFKVVPEGTKYMSAEGEGTVQPGSVLRIDGQGRPYQSTVEFMTKKVQLSDAQLEQLSSVDPVAVELFRNPNGMLSKIPAQYRKQALPIIKEVTEYYSQLEKGSAISCNPGRPSAQSIKFRIDLQGGPEAIIKSRLLKELGVKSIRGMNGYNGGDPLVGFAYNGKLYSLDCEGFGNCASYYNAMFDQITTGKPILKEVTEFKPEGVIDGYYFE